MRGFEIYNKYNSLNTVEASFSFQVTALNVFIWHTNQTNNKYIPDFFGRKFGGKKSIYIMVESITTNNTCPDDGTILYKIRHQDNRSTKRVGFHNRPLAFGFFEQGFFHKYLSDCTLLFYLLKVVLVIEIVKLSLIFIQDCIQYKFLHEILSRVVVFGVQLKY